MRLIKRAWLVLSDCHVADGMLSYVMDGQPLANKCNLSVDQRDTILYAMGIPAIFSTVLCMVAILAVVLLGLSKLFIYRLTMYQVLGSLCQSFSMAFQFSLFRYSGDLLYYRVICRAVAFLLQYSLFMKLMFTVWLTIHLFSYVIFFKNLKSLECRAHCWFRFSLRAYL